MASIRYLNARGALPRPVGLDGAVYLGLFEQNASVVEIRYHQTKNGVVGVELDGWEDFSG